MDDLAQVIRFAEKEIPAMHRYRPPLSHGKWHRSDCSVIGIAVHSPAGELVASGLLTPMSGDPNTGHVTCIAVAQPHRRKGIARWILRHLLQEAKTRRYQALELETDNEEAIALPEIRLRNTALKQAGKR